VKGKWLRVNGLQNLQRSTTQSPRALYQPKIKQSAQGLPVNDFKKAPFAIAKGAFLLRRFKKAFFAPQIFILFLFMKPFHRLPFLKGNRMVTK